MSRPFARLFQFCKGVVDSELSLNISRETIQQSRQLKLIGSNIEKKIKNELLDMLKNEREKYDEFFKNFGLQLKYGIYSSYGMNKEVLQDLIMFKSVKEDKYVTLKEYVEKLAEEDKNIYYGNAKTVDGVKNLPQSERILDEGKDILLFADDVDEFAIKMLGEYEGKTFKNVLSESAKDVEGDDKLNENNKGILEEIKNALGEKVAKVRLTSSLKNRPVGLSAEGEISLEMEKVLSQMPNGEGVKAQKVLEINANHPIFEKLKTVYLNDKDSLSSYAEILYFSARLVSGLDVDNASSVTDKIIELLSK